jgi:signal transduction histidine kinase
MHERSRLGSNTYGGKLAFPLFVIAAYGSTLLVQPRAFTLPGAIVLLAAGVVYVMVGLYSVGRGARADVPSVAVAYFAVQILLGATIIYVSHGLGAIGLVMIPLAAQSVLWLPRRWMLLVCALLVVAEAVPRGLLGGWVVAAQAGMVYLPGIALTAFLMQVAVRERQARAEVERLATALREANRQLEAASHAKSAFLANMSHELRTPLNAIMGFTRLVMRRSQDVLPARQYENLEKIFMSAEHLLGLINDILDLSKIEAGRLELHPVDVVLTPLVEVCLRASIMASATPF